MTRYTIGQTATLLALAIMTCRCSKPALTRSEATQLLANRPNLRRLVQGKLETTQGTDILGGISYDLDMDASYSAALLRWEKAGLVVLQRDNPSSKYVKILLSAAGRQSVGAHVPRSPMEAYYVPLCQELPGEVTGIASDEKAATVTFNVVHGSVTPWGQGDTRCTSPSRTDKALFRRYDDGWRYESPIPAQ